MKSFGKIFSESFRDYKIKFPAFLKVFLFLYLPSIILGIFAILSLVLMVGANFFTMEQELNGVITNFILSGGFDIYRIFPYLSLFFTLLLASIILALFAQLSYFQIALSEKKTSFKEVFNFSRRSFWKYVGLTFVSSFFLVFLFLALIIPGIIFSVYWIFAYYVLIAENKGVMSSLKRSKEIVKGRWWRVFGFTILIGLILVIISFFMNFIPLLVYVVDSLVLVPFGILFFKNLYLDLKKNPVKRKKKK